MNNYFEVCDYCNTRIAWVDNKPPTGPCPMCAAPLGNIQLENLTVVEPPEVPATHITRHYSCKEVAYIYTLYRFDKSTQICKIYDGELMIQQCPLDYIIGRISRTFGLSNDELKQIQFMAMS